jgi:ferrous iron transport protein A
MPDTETYDLKQGLDRISRGEVRRISGFGVGDSQMISRLREIGFAEGDEVELLGRGWLGGAPLSFRLNRTIVALRRNEAALVLVEPV